MSSLKEKAASLLDGNAKRGKGYYYTAPSRKKYPHQWSWDSSFHAIVNSRLGRNELAIEETLTLLNSIMPDGRLPHIIMHESRTRSLNNRLMRFYWPQGGRSPLVQPPVVALAVREIWKRTEDMGFLKEALPPLERHFEWLNNNRRFGKSSLVSIISPWECGLDHKPVFDRLLGRLARIPYGRYLALYCREIMLARQKFDPAVIKSKGYFNVREVLFNTVYALGMESLEGLYAALGDRAKADLYHERRLEVENALVEECYDPASGFFFDIDVNTGQLLAEPSISCLLPLVLGDIPMEQFNRLVNHLTDRDEFWLAFPVPSVPANNRHFEPEGRRYLWRGPTWINTNWFIAEGLKRHGRNDLANAIANSSRELVGRSGFREYYNPLTGEGGGEKCFGWSTLASIM